MRRCPISSADVLGPAKCRVFVAGGRLPTEDIDAGSAEDSRKDKNALGGLGARSHYQGVCRGET